MISRLLVNRGGVVDHCLYSSATQELLQFVATIGFYRELVPNPFAGAVRRARHLQRRVTEPANVSTRELSAAPIPRVQVSDAPIQQRGLQLIQPGIHALPCIVELPP